MRASMERLQRQTVTIAGTLATVAIGAPVVAVLMTPVVFPIALIVAFALFARLARRSPASASVGPVAQAVAEPEARARAARLLSEAGARPP